MIWKRIAISFFISSCSAFASDKVDTRVWRDSFGEHALIIERGVENDGGGEYLLVKQMTEGKNDWVLKDFVRDCDLDVKLNVIKESVEINKIPGTVFFAYRIGCVGGIDSVTVKYFAYRNGVKYALRGDEHLVIRNDDSGDDNPPVPDFNLRNDKVLLTYMLKKWKTVSTTKIN